MARCRFGGQTKAAAGLFEGQGAFPPDKIEKIETNWVREGPQLIRLGQHKITDGVQA